MLPIAGLDDFFWTTESLFPLPRFEPRSAQPVVTIPTAFYLCSIKNQDFISNVPSVTAFPVKFIRGFALAYVPSLLLLSRINFFAFAAYLTAFIINFLSL